MTGKWNTTLRILIGNVPPFYFIKLNPANSSEFHKVGPVVKMIFEILNSLHLRFTVEPGNTIFGRRNASGHWSGIIGKLQRHEADVAIAGGLNSGRSEVVTFSTTCYNYPVSILGGTAMSSDSANILRLTSVFDLEVWILLFISLVLLIFSSSFRIAEKSSSDDDQEYYRPLGIRKTKIMSSSIVHCLTKKGLSKVFSCYLSALFLEGTPHSPPSTRGRCLFAIWWLAMLVLANGFCGIMRAFLITPPSDTKIRDLSHLVTLSNHIQPITLGQSIFEDFFKNGKTQEQQLIWKVLNDKEGLKSMTDLFSDESLLKVSKGMSVIIAVEENVKISSSHKCHALNISNFYWAREPVFTNYGAVMFSQNLNKDVIYAVNQRILLYKESHILEKWIEVEMHRSDTCFSLGMVSTYERSLGLDELAGLFYMYCVCLMISTGALFVEIASTIFSVMNRNAF